MFALVCPVPGGGPADRRVVDRLVHRAKSGSPVKVGQIHIHTANLRAGYRMRIVLRAAGYAVERSYAVTMWTRFF